MDNTDTYIVKPSVLDVEDSAGYQRLVTFLRVRCRVAGR